MEHTSSNRDRLKKSSSDRQRDSEQESGASKTPSGSVSSLHRSMGNQAVQQLHEIGILQPKLEVNQPGSKYEREAKRVAEQVMEMPNPDTASSVGQEVDRTDVTAEAYESGFGSEAESGSESGVEQKQRTETAGPGDAGEPLSATIQAGASSIPAVGTAPSHESASVRTAGPTVDDRTEREITSHTGQPLSNSARSFFEPRFGEDFGDVRVHRDGRSDRLTRSLQAKAFTVGNDIFFRSDAYSPHSREGKHLMAHELSHVVQQRNSPDVSRRIQRWGWAVAGIAATVIAAGVSIAVSSAGGDVEVPADGTQEIAGTKSGKQKYSEGNYQEGEGKVRVEMGSSSQGYGYEEVDVGATVPFHYMRSEQDQLVGPIAFKKDGSDVIDTAGWGGEIDINAYPDPSPDAAEMIFSIKGTATPTLGQGHEGGATWRMHPNGSYTGRSEGKGFAAWLEL